jgi:hypothetical protein
MTEQATLDIDAGAPDFERLQEHEAWFTPAPVVWQGLAWVQQNLLGSGVSRFLDPSAGAGVFGQEAARLWPDSDRYAIEIREEERRHLKRHHHWVAIGTGPRRSTKRLRRHSAKRTSRSSWSLFGHCSWQGRQPRPLLPSVGRSL